MLENTVVMEDLTPSAEQIERAEILIEETLEIEEVVEAIPEAEVVEETTSETIIEELDEVAVVETVQLTSELAVNIEPEAVPDGIVQSAISIDTAEIIDDVRSEAIANIGDDSDVVPTVDVDVDSLIAVPQPALVAESRVVEPSAEQTIAAAVGIFDDGTDGNDLLFGTPFDDFLFGGAGDDIVVGLPGNDRIFGEAGSDFLIGGLGNDVVDGGAGNDLIFGEDSRTDPNDGGKDVIRGGDGIDVIFAGGSNDTVFGDNGNDVINGESGRDILNGGDGSDVIDGGDGNDRLFGDSGNDLLDGGSGSDSINAEDGDDVAHGGRGGDTIFGGRGSDTLDGGRGRDSIVGGAGNDSVIGGNGDDTISGIDFASGLPGFGEIDTLEGGRGADLFELGDANDFFYDDGQDIAVDSIPTGINDYGLIEDFEIDNDLIQLNGSSDQYILLEARDFFNTSQLPDGTSIYRLTPAAFASPLREPSGRPAESFPLSELDGIELGGIINTNGLIVDPNPASAESFIELVGVVKDIDPSQLSLDNSSQFTFV